MSARVPGPVSVCWSTNIGPIVGLCWLAAAVGCRAAADGGEPTRGKAGMEAPAPAASEDAGLPDAGGPVSVSERREVAPLDAGAEPGQPALPSAGKPAQPASAGKPAKPASAGMTGSMQVSTTPLRDWPARERARVLISGHSLTDNPLGDYVAKLAQQHARDYGWEQQIVIGSPVRYRTRGDDSHDPNFSGYSLGKNRDSFEKNILHELAMPTGIGADEHYETLVITERHDILGVIGGEDTVPLLRHYHDRLREHANQTRTLFYQSWPEIDLSKPEAWIAYQSRELGAWECAASKVNLSLERDAAAPTVTVIPVAVALAKFVERVLAGAVPELGGTQQERLGAIFMDDVHLTALGAYLAAAATYSAVFASTPAGVEPPPNVNASAAALASDLAWEVVSTYYRATVEPWRRSMEDCRSQLSALCPEYMAIRQLEDKSNFCSMWQKPDGPLSWPDASFPLPAP